MSKKMVCVVCVLVVLLLGFAAASGAGEPLGSVLVYGPSIFQPELLEGSIVAEGEAAMMAAYTPTVVGAQEWGSMTVPEFAGFDAIVIGDGGCSDSSGFDLAPVNGNKDVWSAAVTGNILVHTFATTASQLGKLSMDADPVALMVDGIAYAAGGGGTGLYFANGCRAYQAKMAEGGVGPFEIAPLSELGTFSMFGGAADFISVIQPDHPAMAQSTSGSLSGWKPSTYAVFSAPFLEGGTFLPPGFLALAVTGILDEGLDPVILARDGDGSLFTETFDQDLGPMDLDGKGSLETAWYWEGLCPPNDLVRPPLEGKVLDGAARFGVPPGMTLEGPPQHCMDYGHEGSVNNAAPAEPEGLCKIPGTFLAMATPPIDVRSCLPAGPILVEGELPVVFAELSFNYFLDFEESSEFDRAAVVAAVSGGISEGGPIGIPFPVASNDEPDGGLIDNDGAAWQSASFLVPLEPQIFLTEGLGLDLQVAFLGELEDGCNNRGAGFYVDNVKVRCADPPPIFADGFESGDTSSWSTAAP